jgi:hypothetical protein
VTELQSYLRNPEAALNDLCSSREIVSFKKFKSCWSSSLLQRIISA